MISFSRKNSVLRNSNMQRANLGVNLEKDGAQSARSTQQHSFRDTSSFDIGDPLSSDMDRIGLFVDQPMEKPSTITSSVALGLQSTLLNDLQKGPLSHRESGDDQFEFPDNTLEHEDAVSTSSIDW